MKVCQWIFIMITLFFMSCDDSGLFKVMPESDILALEGLHEAYDKALTYNDSLQLCDATPGSCDSMQMAYFEEMFHHFDSLYDFHHDNYSHNNIGDDHHHVGNNDFMDHNGMMDDHEDYVHTNENHDYMHNSETHELMDQQRTSHEEFH